MKESPKSCQPSATGLGSASRLRVLFGGLGLRRSVRLAPYSHLRNGIDSESPKSCQPSATGLGSASRLRVLFGGLGLRHSVRLTPYSHLRNGIDSGETKSCRPSATGLGSASRLRVLFGGHGLRCSVRLAPYSHLRNGIDSGETKSGQPSATGGQPPLTDRRLLRLTGSHCVSPQAKHCQRRLVALGLRSGWLAVLDVAGAGLLGLAFGVVFGLMEIWR